jgi:hypothetical protein
LNLELVVNKIAKMDSFEKHYQHHTDVQAVEAGLVERSCPSAMSEVRTYNPPWA